MAKAMTAELAANRASDPPARGDAAARIAQLEDEVALYKNILERVMQVSDEAANGNLEARILHSQSSEELRRAAGSVNHLLDMTDAFLREAGAALEHASQGKFFRRVLLRGMRGTFHHKSRLINEATEKMARNAASLKEVQEQISKSAAIAQGAVKEAGTAVGVVKQLGEASKRIGDVVKTISQIAWQTKLLAFNAKIEASRAGDAGRGFEVVAQEVKDLAQQTATATESISQEIAAVRREVEHTVKVIEDVSKTIHDMQEISAAIERSVVEQGQSQN